MERNNPLAGDKKRVLVRKKETSRYCKSSLYCVISVSDSFSHFVAEFLHCSVKSGPSLQPWDTHRDTHGWRLSLRQEVLSTNVFLESKLFSFPLHLFIKWSRGGVRDVDCPIRMYRYVFKKISWNIEIHSELLFSYKSLVTSSDV